MTRLRIVSVSDRACSALWVRTNLLAAAIPLLLAAGCHTLPKPAELVALDELRQDARVQRARRQQADTMRESDQAHARALAAWQDNEIARARHYALVSTIKTRIAMTAVEEQRVRADLEQMEQKVVSLHRESGALGQEISRTNEMIQLYEELAVARSATKEKEVHLSDVQQRAQAQHKLSEAMLALKMAEAVEAQRYAKNSYVIAQTLAIQCNEAFAQHKYSEASASAEMATKKAREAAEAARPQHLSQKRAAEEHTSAQALQREATAIATGKRGVSVRLEARDRGQRLIIRATFFFPPNGKRPHPKKRVVLDELALLLKKYPDYPVQIHGHTSYRTPKAERSTLSVARAEFVARLLKTKGIPADRCTVDGRGAKELIGYGHSPINDRIEIALLLP